jgi:hypothetical protein
MDERRGSPHTALPWRGIRQTLWANGSRTTCAAGDGSSLGVKDAGIMLGISEVTVRTHLQHIYAKTGTSKQTELLNLVRNAIPPLKPT